MADLFASSWRSPVAGLRSLSRALVRLKVVLVAVGRPGGLLVERI